MTKRAEFRRDPVAYAGLHDVLKVQHRAYIDACARCGGDFSARAVVDAEKRLVHTLGLLIQYEEPKLQATHNTVVVDDLGPPEHQLALLREIVRRLGWAEPKRINGGKS
jgi:hypothetical protein